MPDNVQVSSEDALSAANNPMIPHNLFSAPGSLATRTNLVWETVACGPANWANFTTTLFQPARITHVRFWAHANRACQRFTRLIVCGDGILIMEYGAECRPPPPPEGFRLAHWTELSSAVTLAFPATVPYLRYRFEFPDTCSAEAPGAHTVSLGRAQLHDVPDGAAVPGGMFLAAPVWEPADSIVCGRGAHVQHQLRAQAAQSQVTFALAHGAQLPEGLALSPGGLISGQVKEKVPGEVKVGFRGGAGVQWWRLRCGDAHHHARAGVSTWKFGLSGP